MRRTQVWERNQFQRSDRYHLTLQGRPVVVRERPPTMRIAKVDIVGSNKKKQVWRGQTSMNPLSGSDQGAQKQVQKSLEKMSKDFPPHGAPRRSFGPIC